MDRVANAALIEAIERAGISHKALARRVNQIGAYYGEHRAYTHTSVANWCRGITPAGRCAHWIAQALSERRGGRVTVADIGMAGCGDQEWIGLEFPRDLPHAIDAATRTWSHVHRRDALYTVTGFALAAYTVPVRRWLITSADPNAAHRGGTRHVGMADIDHLRVAARDARQWDSRYGGGNWRAGSLAACLHRTAAPLLASTYTDTTGRSLFSVTAELTRMAGWTAFDTDDHDLAQRYFIQALRLARAVGDIPLGAYVLTTMALQTSLRGHHAEAIDMAHGAYERAKHAAPARVLGFTKLIEARAWARAHQRRHAEAALLAADRHLARAGHGDPSWIDFFTPQRLAADAVEIYRDLHLPAPAHRWACQATMPADAFARSYGIRQAVIGTIHLQQHDLDLALACGHQSLSVLSGVASAGP